MSTATDPRRAERGASVSEYALIMSMFVLVLTAVIQLLTENGEALMNNTASGIATPRPYSDAVVQIPVSVAPPWAATTSTPSNLLTYVEKPIRTTEGDCLAWSGGLITAGACGAADELLLTGLSEDGTHLSLYLGDASNCLTGVPTAVPAEVVAAPCGGGGQTWTQVDVAGLDVVYRHVDSGLCLAAVVAPPPTTTSSSTPSSTSTAPSSTTSTSTTVPASSSTSTISTTTTTAPVPAGALTLAACDGSASQTLSVLY